jgi:hypothetical protein
MLQSIDEKEFPMHFDLQLAAATVTDNLVHYKSSSEHHPPFWAMISNGGKKRIFPVNSVQMCEHGNLQHHQAVIDGLWVSDFDSFSL